MQDGQNTIRKHRTALSLILYGINASAAVRRVILDAEQFLGAMGLDYEILVVGCGGCAGELEAEETDENARIRCLAGEGTPGYAEALRVGLAHARHDALVVTNGGAAPPALES